MSGSVSGITFGGLLGAATLTVDIRKAQMPGSVTLISTDGSRKIEFSCNGGVSFFQPTYDQSPAAFITVAYLAPISHVKFTGAATDAYTVM